MIPRVDLRNPGFQCHGLVLSDSESSFLHGDDALPVHGLWCADLGLLVNHASVLLLAGESCQLPPGLCVSSISAYASELASEDD